MARFKLEMETWPIARLEARIANLLKGKNDEIEHPIKFNPWAKQSGRRKPVSGTITGPQLAEMILGPLKPGKAAP